MGADPAAALFVDDSDEGLYGFDPVDTYRADVSGVHALDIVNMEGLATGYRLDLSAG